MIRRRLYQSLLNALVPLSAIRHAQAFGWDSQWLADVEADHDSWQPDELWAAQQRHPTSRSVHSPRAEHSLPSAGGKHRAQPPLRLVRAAEADDSPVSATSFGGPLKSDEQIIEELVADYREFLNECFARRFPPSS